MTTNAMTKNAITGHALKLLCLAALSMVVSTARADVRIDEPWVRATVPGQSASGAFMRLTSSEPVRLVSASAKIADTVEVHEMSMSDNVMRMKQVPAVELPAGKTVELAPGGYHIMFFKLHGQLKDGDTVPMTLVFEDAQGKRSMMDVQAPVRPLTTSMPAGHGTKMGHGAHK